MKIPISSDTRKYQIAGSIFCLVFPFIIFLYEGLKSNEIQAIRFLLVPGVAFIIFYLSVNGKRSSHKLSHTFLLGKLLFLIYSTLLALILDSVLLLLLERLFNANEFFNVFSSDKWITRFSLMWPWYLIYNFILILLQLLFKEMERNDIWQLEKTSKDRQISLNHLNFLNSQINSHFLFNTMNSISMQIRKGEGKKATSQLAHLSQLLRSILNFKSQWLHSLQEEVEVLKSYIEIEQLRSNNKWNIIWRIDSETITNTVPVLILQPIIENAFKYGGQKDSNCDICIKSRLENDYLILSVENSNSTFMSFENDLSGSGIGLSNTVERLQNIYGTRSILQTENTSKGVLITLKIPNESTKENGL